ncbi:MAG: 2-oxoglutarate and iron-dependent oxygenase domain-containing protein [Xanthobacteraceae bacterium]
MKRALPIIDVSAFLEERAGGAAAPHEIEKACREFGFFYAAGHGVGGETVRALKEASARFFALPAASKMEIPLARGGRAWRGYFPLGGELTSGVPDLKEGLYFGEDLDASDPRVSAGWPLHGANLFPKDVPELAVAVRAFMAEAERAAHAIMAGLALSLGLDASYFHGRYTRRPTLLFRIFHYPSTAANDARWGVGEHTDYGLLTLLAQDDVGGLQVKTAQGWLEAPPIPETLVCNIGDMLDRLTGGYYRSTPHRVRNTSGRERYSFPFFFDPAFDAEIEPLPARAGLTEDDSATRWDKSNVHAFGGSYGDYLLGKVAKVFPGLARDVRIS